MPREKQFDEDKVIEQFTGAFRSKGYNACSIGDLVDASGLSRSSLYDTFGDKEQLFIRCLQHYDTGMKNALEEVTRSKGTALEKIEAALNMPFQTRNSKLACTGCLVVNTFTETEHAGSAIREAILDMKHNMEDTFAGYVKEGQEKGEIITLETPKSLGRFLYTVMSGMLILQKATPDNSFHTRNITLVVNMLKA